MVVVFFPNHLEGEWEKFGLVWTLDIGHRSRIFRMVDPITLLLDPLFHICLEGFVRENFYCCSSSGNILSHILSRARLDMSLYCILHMCSRSPGA